MDKYRRIAQTQRSPSRNLVSRAKWRVLHSSSSRQEWLWMMGNIRTSNIFKVLLHSRINVRYPEASVFCVCVGTMKDVSKFNQ